MWSSAFLGVVYTFFFIEELATKRKRLLLTVWAILASVNWACVFTYLMHK